MLLVDGGMSASARSLRGGRREPEVLLTDEEEGALEHISDRQGDPSTPSRPLLSFPPSVIRRRRS